MQSDNEKMLQEIVQNTEMGKNTLDELMSLTHDQKLRDEMLRQKREYRRINQAAHTALDAIGAEAHGQSAAARMSVSMGIRTRTMMDKSTRNLATMLAEGSGQPRPQPGEISQALWVEPERALELLSFREDRRLLRKTLERYVKA